MNDNFIHETLTVEYVARCGRCDIDADAATYDNQYYTSYGTM